MMRQRYGAWHLMGILAAVLLFEAEVARAQVRQPTPTPAPAAMSPTPSPTAPAPAPTQNFAQIDPQLLTLIDPLKVEVQNLRAEIESLRAQVAKLEGELQSLRQVHAQHKHSIPYFGVTSAKTIYPGTPASDDTLVAFTCQPCMKTGLSGPPAQ
jgi:hypothetical protein